MGIEREVEHRHETGIRFANGECENLAEYFPTWKDAYDYVLSVIQREHKKHGTELQGYIYDRLAHYGAEDCRYIDHDGDTVEITYRDPRNGIRIK